MVVWLGRDGRDLCVQRARGRRGCRVPRLPRVVALVSEQERRELDNRKQMVALEMDWANRGVKARVKRNVRRLEQAHEIRDQYERDKSAYRQATKKIKVTAKKGVDDHAKVVAEFYNVHKSFGEGDQKKTILEKFSLLIII